MKFEQRNELDLESGDAGQVNTESGRRTTFADMGMPTPVFTHSTPIGKVRSLQNITIQEWIFLVVTLLSLLVAFGLTLYKVIVPGDNFNNNDFTYALLLMLNIVFCIYYVIHGIIKERSDELAVFEVTIVIVLLYCIFNYVLGANKGLLKLVRLILVSSLGPLLFLCGCFFTWKYHLSNQLIIRTVGASSDDQKMCKLLYRFSSLLKFDLQLQLSMFILVLEKWQSLSQNTIIILSVGIFITFSWVIIGYLANRLENKNLVGAFYALSLFEPGYLLYKMSLINMKQGDNSHLKAAVMTCGVLGLLIWFSTVIVMYFVMRNYGKGLKEKIYGNSPQPTPQPSVPTTPKLSSEGSGRQHLMEGTPSGEANNSSSISSNN